MIEKYEGANRIIEFIGSSLTNASELAYVEGAQETAHLLGCMQNLLRYIKKQNEWVPLADEFAALADYMLVCKLRYADHIHFEVPEVPSCFIRHMQIVGSVMDICMPNVMVAEQDTFLDLQFSCSRQENGYVLMLRAVKTYRGGSEEIIRQWNL